MKEEFGEKEIKSEKFETFIPQDEKINKEFWAAEWKKRIKEGDIEPFTDFVSPEEYKAVLKEHFKTLDLKDKTFLEVGVGTGSKLAETLNELGANVVGVDIAQAPLETARKKKIAPVVGSAFHLPSRDNSFDGVISINLVNTSAGTDVTSLQKLLMENCRVLKEGGIFIQSHYGYAMREIPAETQLLMAKLAGFKNVQKIENEILKILEDSIYALAYHATK